MNLLTKFALKTKILKLLSNWKSNVLNKLKNKTNTLTRNKQNHKKHAPVLEDPDVLAYLRDFQKKFVIVTVDKASNNFAFICNKFYVSRILEGTMGFFFTA